MKILLEMALSRTDAIDLCISLGKQFIEHFAKVYDDYKNNSEEKHHHINEMQSWWDKVRKIRLKQNNKMLSNTNLIDWFFTAGSSTDDYISDSIIDECYNDFIIKVLRNKDIMLKDILQEIFI